MAIFSKDPDKAVAKREKAFAAAEEKAAKTREQAERLAEKAGARAAKKGVAVAGAVTVGHTFDDSAEQFLVVFPDRVELVNKGKAGSLFRSGAGTETIPISRISSAECKNEGISSVLEVHTSGNTIRFKADQVSGPYLREMILEQMNSAGDGSATSAAGASDVSVTDQLHKLGDLHQAGILTDEEFAKKKAELLDRL